MTQAPDPTRAAFEEWAYIRDFDITRSNCGGRADGRYASERTQGAWSAWQHCEASFRAPHTAAPVADQLAFDAWWSNVRQAEDAHQAAEEAWNYRGSIAPAADRDKYGRCAECGVVRTMMIPSNCARQGCPERGAPAADRAVSEPISLRQPMPDDLLTVANIESDGITLTLEIGQLGDLVHLIGEDERTFTLTIAPMRRADFDNLGDFNGF